MISEPEVNRSDLLESNWLQKGIQSQPFDWCEQCPVTQASTESSPQQVWYCKDCMFVYTLLNDL